MKKNSSFIKGLTLTGFVLMITTLVAFRSGFFTSNTNDLSVYHTLKHSVDSPPLKPAVMPGSKSAPVFYGNKKKALPVNQNTPAQQNNKPKKAKKDTSQKKIYMGSSKSGRVFPSETIKDEKNNKDL